MIFKNKILVAVVEIIVLFFLIDASQANDTNTPEKDSYWDSLKSESLTEYPDGWFFTLDQMAELYEIEYNEGNRLINYIKRENGKFITQCNGEAFDIHEQFILTTMGHLKELLDRGLVKYLFRLDSFHSHPFVIDQQFVKEYSGLNNFEMTKKYVVDTSLGTLFHNAEHLALRTPPKIGSIDPQAQELITKRNVIGWYDGRKTEILFPQKKELVGSGKSNTAIIPEGYRGVGSIIYKATKNGEFSIKHKGKQIRLDISLFECYYY